MAIPAHVRYLIAGAGIHGLSTAWHLAARLNASGRGSGADVLVIDKTGIASGASGIACGVVRNNYFQPAMRELMAECVRVWESDPRAFSYHPVGFMQVSHQAMGEDVAGIAREQAAIGYESVFVDGAADTRRYLRTLLDDWRAEGVTSVLHEKMGGYANNTAALYGLATKAEAEGVRILGGCELSGFRLRGGAVEAVETSKGVIGCDQVVIALGPWVKSAWDLLELPREIALRDGDGTLHENVPMWTYWSLQEGTLGVDPDLQRTNDGELPPVIHVDSDAPLRSDEDGSPITEQPWGIYYKPDFHFKGVQGGAMPYRVDKPADEVAVDPYGPQSPEFVVGPEFANLWVSGLAFCQRRFQGTMARYRKEPSGGIGCFTPDSFPVFDRFRENAYFVADSNHGFKMIAVGKLVAEELLGAHSALLDPFRFSRYAEGRLHPVSRSPFPWS